MKDLLLSQYEDHLSPFAQKSAESRGRKYKEMPHPFRNPYQRDRDRVVHSRAFRRLEYKTQVLLNSLGDHYRTRLTHSLEVSLIARSVARVLGLHEDLVEAIALAHDLGHPPFGHAGEKALDSKMKDEGGFEHNVQSLRIVDTLESKYPQFPGLNLTYEVRRALIKHSDLAKFKFLKKENFNLQEMPFLEAQVVDVADSITYSCHDLEDGLSYGFLKMESVKKLSIWDFVDTAHPYLAKSLSEEVVSYHLIRSLIDFLVKSLVQETRKNLEAKAIKTVKDITAQKSYLAGLSPEIEGAFSEFKEFLMKNFYKHPEIVKMTGESENILKGLFDHFLKDPSGLPGSTYTKTKYRSLKRVICDYVAGMTDRFAMEEYRRRVKS